MDQRVAVAGAAALALVAIVGAVAVRQAVFDGDDGDAATQVIPNAPDGTRYVGAGQAVVAVPEWWTTGETQCLTPVETTVAWFSGAVADCQDPAPPGVVREVSFLEVMDATSGYGEHMMSTMEPIDPVDGVEVLEAVGCNDWYAGTCRRLFAVPSEGVAFAVTLADAQDGDYETIRDSLRILPDGVTTVPLDAGFGGYTPAWGDEPAVVPSLVQKIEAAGLRAEIVQAPPPAPTAISPPTWCRAPTSVPSPSSAVRSSAAAPSRSPWHPCHCPRPTGHRVSAVTPHSGAVGSHSTTTAASISPTANSRRTPSGPRGTRPNSTRA